MPWTSGDGATWEERFGFVKGFCNHYMRELDRVLKTSETPKKSFPQDWAKREAVVHILNRMKEIEEEELGDPVEVLSKRFNHFADVVIDGIKRTLAEQQSSKPQTSTKKINIEVTDRKADFTLEQHLQLEKRVRYLEELLQSVGRTINEQNRNRKLCD